MRRGSESSGSCSGIGSAAPWCPPESSNSRSCGSGSPAGDGWAYLTLILANLALAPYDAVLIGRYVRAGARLRILEIPPLIWVPAIVVPIAIVLGWIGLVT